jgi:hypothetical protein
MLMNIPSTSVFKFFDRETLMRRLSLLPFHQFVNIRMYIIIIIIISGTTARIGPWPPLTGFRDG